MGPWNICWRPVKGGVLVTQFLKNREEFRRWANQHFDDKDLEVLSYTAGLQEELDKKVDTDVVDNEF